MKNANVIASPRAPQAKILAFPQRGKPASTSPWAVNAPPARDPIYDEPWYRVMKAILNGYSEQLGDSGWWSVRINGRLICHSRAPEGWGSNNKLDAYLTVCAVAGMLGYGELVTEEFVFDVYDIANHNLPSQAELAAAF